MLCNQVLHFVAGQGLIVNDHAGHSVIFRSTINSFPSRRVFSSCRRKNNSSSLRRILTRPIPPADKRCVASNCTEFRQLKCRRPSAEVNRILIYEPRPSGSTLYLIAFSTKVVKRFDGIMMSFISNASSFCWTSMEVTNASLRIFSKSKKLDKNSISEHKETFSSPFSYN